MNKVLNPNGSVANPWYECQWEQPVDTPLDLQAAERAVDVVITKLIEVGGTFPIEFTVYRSREIVTMNGVVNRYTVAGIATLPTTRDIVAAIEALDNADVPTDNRQVWPNGGKE